MIKIVMLPEVVDYFLELASILYDKRYLGFEETAIQYATGLFDDIRFNLPNKHKKLAPAYFERYGKGMFYAIFKRNKNTSWYVFFNVYNNRGEIVYFVRHVSNNHVVARHL